MLKKLVPLIPRNSNFVELFVTQVSGNYRDIIQIANKERSHYTLNPQRMGIARKDFMAFSTSLVGNTEHMTIETNCKEILI